MKNTIKVLGVIAFIAAIGFSFVACGGGDSGDNGGGKTLTGIAVTTQPTKTEYNIGDTTLDKTGMVVTATYDDGTTEAVTDYTLSVFDSSTAGNKTITVTYKGKTANFSVNVINPDLETVEKPTASPAAGTYPTAQNVTLTTATTGAAIYYTIDGTTPTKNPSTLYSSAISVSATTTVKAIAVKEGMNDSDILEAVYTINSGSGGGTVPVITTTSLPNGTVGTAYSQTLEATGDAPITWSVATGALPAGLNLGSTGVISGTPTSAETCNFTVKATNSAGEITKALSIIISPIPTFSTIAEFATWLTAQPANAATTAYSVKLNVSDSISTLGAAGSLGSALQGNNGKYVSLDLSGSSFTTIPANAFYSAPSTSCANLTKITIPNTVTSIGNNAFQGCNNLTSVTIPNDITSLTIGNDAFRNCSKLSGTLTIPNGVTSIGNYAFSGCSELTTVMIGSGLASIGDGAFTYCTGLTTINVNTSNVNFSGDGIEGVLYNKAKTSLLVYPVGKTGDTFTIPTSVTSIGKAAFQSNNNLTSITIPNTVADIGDGTFAYCVGLISVKFERTDTNIADSSFEGGVSLKTAYAAGNIGTYTRSGDGSAVPYTWAKE